MMLGKRRVVPTLFLLVLLALAARTAWVASHLETGWTCLLAHCRDATLGWFGKQVPVPNREPSDQADFWVPEAWRIVAANPQSTEIAMGGAFVLDTPAVGFMRRYVKARKPIGLPGVAFPEVDHEGIRRATDQFHAEAEQQCLALAARATELEPGDVRWWRLRALLQFQGDLYGDAGLRDGGTLDVLEECVRHDPDNALYDYLAAEHFWQRSAIHEWQVEGWKLEVKDSETFAQGTKCFERGLEKKRFAVGQAEFAPVIEFLSQARLPCTDHDEILNSRTVFPVRMALFLRELLYWQQARAETREREGDAAGALALFRQYSHLLDQYEQSGNPASFGLIFHAMRTVTCANLHKLIEEHPDLVSEERRDEIRAEYLAARLEGKVLGTAYQKRSAQQGTQQAVALTLAGIVWGVTLPLAVLLIVIGCLAWLIARCLGKRQDQRRPALGPLRHAIAWMAGYGLTFVVLGLAPAEVISHRVQAWAIGIVAALAVVGFPIWILWLIRRRKFQYSLRTLFIVTLVVAVLCALVTSSGVSLDDVTAPVHVPARGWEGMDAQVLKGLIESRQGIWCWVAVQWSAYSGMSVSLVVSLLLVAVWQAARFSRARSEGNREDRSPDRKTGWAATLRCVSKSAVVVAALCLLAYLAMTPYVLRSIDSQHQQQMTYARDPQAYDDSIREEINRIKADSDTMRELRAQVEQELAEEAEREREEETQEKRGMDQEHSEAENQAEP